MSQDTAYGEFIAKVIEVLNKNGFPDNRVSLPLERMYESAYQKGLNFNRVLAFLEAKGIGHEKTTDKIIFFEKERASEDSIPPADHLPGGGQGAPKFPGFDPSLLEKLGMGSGTGMSWSEMAAKASALLKSMPPEQLQQIQDMVQNLSDVEKKDLLEKAKSMGWIK
jgi:hypothetical protein